MDTIQSSDDSRTGRRRLRAKIDQHFYALLIWSAFMASLVVGMVLELHKAR